MPVAPVETEAPAAPAAAAAATAPWGQREAVAALRQAAEAAGHAITNAEIGRALPAIVQAGAEGGPAAAAAHIESLKQQSTPAPQPAPVEPVPPPEAAVPEPPGPVSRPAVSRRAHRAGARGVDTLVQEGGRGASWNRRARRRNRQPGELARQLAQAGGQWHRLMH
jgi:hypothetical protein